jgi:hypothetical protein
MAKSVLPHPALPHIRVGLPLGSPPFVISSSPFMPVGHFSRTFTSRFAFTIVSSRLVYQSEVMSRARSGLQVGNDVILFFALEVIYQEIY